VDLEERVRRLEDALRALVDDVGAFDYTTLRLASTLTNLASYRKALALIDPHDAADDAAAAEATRGKWGAP